MNKNLFLTNEEFKSVKKLKHSVTIFTDQDRKKEFTWKDIKHIKLEDDDYIHSGYQDSYDHGDSSGDGYYYMEIIRMVEETDEEVKIRLEEYEKSMKKIQQQRYENYLKLKKEFEPEIGEEK